MIRTLEQVLQELDNARRRGENPQEVCLSVEEYEEALSRRDFMSWFGFGRTGVAETLLGLPLRVEYR